MKAIIYTRTAIENGSSERQLEQCREFAVGHGWDVAGTYSERGVSGLSADRPTLHLAMEQARGGVLIAPDVAALTRSASGFATILRDADASGVRVVTADGALDTFTREGTVMARLLTVRAAGVPDATAN